jgi:glutathione S-transferase
VSREFQSPDATEKAAVEAALNKCRALAAQIKSELRNKERLVDKASLADFHAALERAAWVLEQTIHTPTSTAKGLREGSREWKRHAQDKA